MSTLLSLSDVSPLLICLVTIAVAVTGGLFPFSPLEPVLIGAAAVGSPRLLVLVVTLATVCQMAAKSILFVASAKAERSMSPRKRALVDRVRVRLDGRPHLQMLAVLISALSGLPPLYIVTVVCGALGLSLRRYLIAGTIGRATRFSMLVMIPQLFAASTLSAQQVDATPAFTMSGHGAQTYVLFAGMVGGVNGFRRLETRLVQQGNRVIVVAPYQLSLDSADVSFAAMARRVDALLAEQGVVGARMVGHAHGAGVMLRVAAMSPQRVSRLYLLDVGALETNRTQTFSASLRLVPLITRMPGGRSFIRGRILAGLRGNSGSDAWLDAATQAAYTEPLLDNIGRVTTMARRLAEAGEPVPLADVVSRIRVPVTVILGDAPRSSAPHAAELEALARLGALLHIERLAGAGHFVHEEQPDAVAALLNPPVGIIALVEQPR
jgi:pimeloyl-ACP methyl ester carboxylesterase